MQEYIIDRLEENFAICENEQKEMVKIEISVLPKNVKEGTVLIYENGKYIISEEKTKRRKEKIKEKMKNLWTKT